MPEEVMENSGEATPRKGGMSWFKILLVIIVLGLVGYGAYMYFGKMGKAVAIVNGQKISMSQYTERYGQLEASIIAQGLPATTTEMQTAIKKQTLDNLVNETLVLQKAEAGGIKVKGDDVEKQIATVKTQLGDENAFAKALQTQGYTESTFRALIERTNVIQQYLSSQISTSSISASDSEIKSLYNQVAAANKSIPPLTEVRGQVESQIVQEKQQKLVNDFIAKLKAESTVEILLQ